MDDTAREFFFHLLKTPSPSGYEEPIQRVVREYLEPLADEIRTDLHGNVIAVKNAGGTPRVMLAGHCDQIGLLVQHIDSDGFLSVQPIGGWDPQVLIGQRMTVWTEQGGIPGVIARKPIHLLKDEEQKKVPKLEDLWLDIGVADGKAAESLVAIGDCVTLELEHRELRDDRIVSPGVDDKCGLWVVLEAFRRASEQKIECALYVVSTVQEEIGLRGARTSAFDIDPQVGIAVDVTHATDCPTIDKKQEGDVKLGGGPVVYRGPNMNPIVTSRLFEIAKRHGIAVQPGAISRATPTDANVMQVNRGGMATGLVSIGNRYMHSPVEMISLADIDAAADLLAQFAIDTGPQSDFTPR